MKNLYLISQDFNNEYDTYDSAVVCAENEEAAKLIHPNENKPDNWMNDEERIYWDWVKPSQVKVQFIGIAHDSIEIGEVICASYNAG